ncbi:putative non-specific serine/threonine protein kinase [Helianthus annuus]|uniref:Non-specific serine/threonine protein kinase n=1 Tax=Helianthus annuus TaxID=4232 RepID=A0A251UYV0_HELAN|nr:receptor-like protein 44 [Helianthus annuus]KAF5798792.1 putative non-specific serine/threonine protein kinase [Helianthus annuus]KAJ0550348.1 putative non-specific serine/threonine protein kinase [Helianthus annuus]KAJ0557045.1 putative non-specific serine/threonine protein kinase [Helianthus annuus]KAJ0563303.1 putative non-specific serine/threonine protein kinase [Helianthus annuus]KAJ0728651.1 putative non-specific serine/threonine protein kinase [Helianthus annuus]
MGFFSLTLMSILMCAFLPPSSQDPNDQSCLTNLFQSMHVPDHNLVNWTEPNLANPCSGFMSNLTGATCNNGRIYKLSLSNLSLYGSISPYISNCTSLQSLDLSNNALTGPIPTEFQYLINLAILDLSSNHLSGTIPPSLTMCMFLNIIDLHNNSLTGPIPPQLGSLVRLSVFDVSDNKLSGVIPTSLVDRPGNLPGFNATSYSGNEDLYGYPLGPMKSRSGLPVLLIVGIGLGSGLISLVLSFVVTCVWLKVTDQKLAAEHQGKINELMPEY